jgi:ABC-type sugar transport system substrate-binding protein
MKRCALAAALLVLVVAAGTASAAKEKKKAAVTHKVTDGSRRVLPSAVACPALIEGAS